MCDRAVPLEYIDIKCRRSGIRLRIMKSKRRGIVKRGGGLKVFVYEYGTFGRFGICESAGIVDAVQFPENQGPQVAAVSTRAPKN